LLWQLTMARQNVGNCVARHFMAQIRQCTPHPEATPTPIFFRHPNDQSSTSFLIVGRPGLRR
jgi:hypothetical protein